MAPTSPSSHSWLTTGSILSSLRLLYRYCPYDVMTRGQKAILNLCD